MSNNRVVGLLLLPVAERPEADQEQTKAAQSRPKQTQAASQRSAVAPMCGSILVIA
ncbi:hypothetical protein LMG28727_03642 [Paraburkholderia kirstenboschensis]|nr:hypothetical protein LMG28727_03642 [Paraburkholderia kirstenboschensis]